MKFLNPILLLVLSVVAWVVGEDNNPTAGLGSFVTLKQSTGNEFRAFVVGPTDARVAVLVVHDYFGISDGTKQSALCFDAPVYRSVAVDRYGGKSATSHEEAVKLMQSVDRKTTDQILPAGLDYLRQPGEWADAVLQRYSGRAGGPQVPRITRSDRAQVDHLMSAFNLRNARAGRLHQEDGLFVSGGGERLRRNPLQGTRIRPKHCWWSAEPL